MARVKVFDVAEAAQYVERVMFSYQQLRAVAHYESLYRQLLLVREHFTLPMLDPDHKANDDAKVKLLLRKATDRLIAVVILDQCEFGYKKLESVERWPSRTQP
jgi:hypothetical protein